MTSRITNNSSPATSQTQYATSKQASNMVDIVHGTLPSEQSTSSSSNSHQIVREQQDDHDVGKSHDNSYKSGSNVNNNPWGLSQEWFDLISRQLIDHMNQYGICVIDNFLGPTKGKIVLNEVETLHLSRKYSKGCLVSDRFNHNNPSTDPGAIRNDRVVWVDGKEPNCSQINNLIQTLSSVITNSSTLSLYSDNELDKIVINKRTKAHVSCYPGNGTRYVKHVDNPNGDGRLITAIYYLNENWNTKREGGLLRMYPTGSNVVANIEPLFDRALFFWSDRRNPHEVLPAYRDRYAITVWFIGDKRV